MKILKLVIIFVVAVAVFYFGAMFLGFNLSGPAILQKGISGSAVLQVKVIMDNKMQDPVGRVEVDVAEKPGPPPDGGVAETDENGVATFHVKPGDYAIYFNELTFPKNLEVPEVKRLMVTQEGPNQVVIQVATVD